MITKVFIIVFVSIAIVYDIWALVTKRRTLTSWFRQWYGKIPIVPYSVGLIFIGHFGLFINFTFINKIVALFIFILLSALYLVYNIIMIARKSGNKLWNFQKKHWYLAMAFGAIVGCLWY